MIVARILAKLHWFVPTLKSFETKDSFYIQCAIEGFDRADKTLLSNEYIDKAVVINDDLSYGIVGACAFVEDRSKFRTVNLPPNGKCWHVKPNAVEMNCLYICPQVPPLARIRFYLKLCDVIFKSFPENTPIFFSYEIKKKGLGRFYDVFTEEIVYEGPVKSVEGMDQDKQYIERICCFTPKYLAKKMPGLVFNRVKRMFK